MNTYIHKTDKRLRIRSDYIKNNPKEVNALITQLDEIDAITHINHKRYAGSVAICFDKEALDCNSLLEILESHHWTNSRDTPSFIEKAMVSGTKTLIKGAASIALNRVVGARVSHFVMNLA